jgi:hypothetical protein
MNWQDYLALSLFAAATIFVARRAYRALFSAVNAGCGSGCGSCSHGKAAAEKTVALLTIDTPMTGRQ